MCFRRSLFLFNLSTCPRVIPPTHPTFSFLIEKKTYYGVPPHVRDVILPCVLWWFLNMGCKFLTPKMNMPSASSAKSFGQVAFGNRLASQLPNQLAQERWGPHRHLATREVESAAHSEVRTWMRMASTRRQSLSSSACQHVHWVSLVVSAP